MNKKLLSKLEEIYSSSVNKMSTDNDSGMDVPNVPDDEYKTHLIFPALEDIEEPEIKTKKGKTVLREPPSSDPDDNKVKNIKFEDVELEDLDRSEVEETVNVLEDNTLQEQDEKEKKKEKPEEDDNGMGEIAQANMGEQNPNSGQDPNTQQGMENPDPSQMMGADPAATGMVDPNVDPVTGETKKTSEQVGRIFELKKVYSRLLAIESQLSFSSDVILLKLRKLVSDAIELFELLISNIDAYQDEIDEIIVMYYDFLQEIYEIMKTYYKNKQAKEKEQNKKDSSKSLP
jgi:hypothetical protein